MAHEPAVEKMIEKVMKKKELSRAAAIDYMLSVATGRLAALWRYTDTVPEGKTTKGVFELRGKKKPAERVDAKPKAARKPKPAKASEATA